MSRSKKAAAPTYLAHVVPGLEHLASLELQKQLPSSSIVQVMKHFDERNSLIIFRYPGPPADLLTLQLVEDVFVLLTENDQIPTGRSALAAIRSAISGDQTFDRALSRAAQTSPVKRSRKPTFRVIARKAGPHAFRRVDLQRAVELAIHDLLPTWTLVGDNARSEIWVTLLRNHLLVGLRLSDITMRRRSYKTSSLPASLKPTVARAMVMLSEPRPDDVFLDPMCGSGTIPIERAHAERYQLIFCGDVDPRAVQATRDNVGPRYKPIQIHQWDARSLSLEDASVSAIVTNLPFGKQIGTHRDNRRLYPALLQEWTRVLKSDGRLVLLTSEGRLLRHLLNQQNDLQLQQEVPVLVRGMTATIHLLHRARST